MTNKHGENDTPDGGRLFAVILVVIITLISIIVIANVISAHIVR